MSKQKIFGHAAALATILVWGTTLLSSDYLLNTAKLSAEAVIFGRFAAAFIVLNIIYPPRLKIQDFRTELTFALAGLCGVSLYFMGENSALLYTQPANVSIIIAASPFFTASLFRIFGRTGKLGAPFFCGFVIAMSGVAVATLGSGKLGLSPKGDIIALAAALAWGFYSLIIDRVNSFGFNPIQTTRRIFFWGLVFMSPFMAFSKFSFTEYTALADMKALFNLLYLGIIASALCYISWNYAMKTISPVIASAYIYGIPVITILFSALLKFKITWLTLLGAALTIAGLVISMIRKKTVETE